MRHALAFAMLLAACHAPLGETVEIDVIPSPAARTADELLLDLVRTDTPQTKHFHFALPHPTPTEPWKLHLTTRNWRDAPLRIDAFANLAGVTVATGSIVVSGTLVTIALADVMTSGLDLGSNDLAVDDLAVGDLRAPDLGASDLKSVSPSTDLGCVPAGVSIGVSADGYMLGASSANYGTADSVLIANGAQSAVGIFRFDISAFPPTSQIVSAQIMLTEAPASSACGPGCDSCVATDVPGQLNAYSMRSDWDEKKFNWTTIDGVQTWSAAGATGAGSDRATSPFAQLSYLPGKGVFFEMPHDRIGELDAWNQKGMYSVQIVAAGGTSIDVYGKDKPCDNSSNVTAQLAVFYCP